MPAAKLPPRKRARTAEEKEQRRVERVIRNRRAAHASREKKRRHVETLEQYVKSLEAAMTTNQRLYKDLAMLLPKDVVVPPLERVKKPEDLGGNEVDPEIDDEEMDVEDVENITLKDNTQDNSMHEDDTGLVSPPQTNPESVFRLPQESILKQEFSPLFGDEENREQVDLDTGLNIYTPEMEGQDALQNPDPLFGLFDSVHPAVM